VITINSIFNFNYMMYAGGGRKGGEKKTIRRRDTQGDESRKDKLDECGSESEGME
jgi:hypothetical protein